MHTIKLNVRSAIMTRDLRKKKTSSHNEICEESEESNKSTDSQQSDSTQTDSNPNLSWTSHEEIRYNLRSRSKNNIPKVDLNAPVPESQLLSTQPIVGAYSRLDPQNTQPQSLRLCMAERKKANFDQMYNSKPTTSKSWMTHSQMVTAQQQLDAAFSRNCTNFDGVFTDVLDRSAFVRDPLLSKQPNDSSGSGQTVQTAFRRSLSINSLPSELSDGHSPECGLSGIAAQSLTDTTQATATTTSSPTATTTSPTTSPRVTIEKAFNFQSNMMFYTDEAEFSLYEEAEETE
ncbi:hypothetical protein BD560DRAFT_424501 [Blakeslea trispora]|nr:hypothetical protein BD560DRAFT_424501 [Blakeslea trispora]